MPVGRVGPHDQLAAGTPVQIGHRRGHVVSCAYVPASNGGMIAVHKITLTEAYQRAARPQYWKTIEPKVWSGNYSGITLIERGSR